MLSNNIRSTLNFILTWNMLSDNRERTLVDEKLNVYIPAFVVTRSTANQLDHASRELAMPRAQVIRLAIIAGLPLVLKSVPHIPRDQR
jgi:hypothetical protein